jgi:dolichyl-phosphate beta-glucosyltransferase
MVSCSPCQYYLSVVIPAYNEEGRISTTLIKIKDYLNMQAFSWEIILVDDGSSDRTVEIAKKILEGENLTVIKNNTNCGKGYSVKSGILRSKGEIILFCDADLSTPIEELEKILMFINKGWDIVIGSRALPDSDIQVHQRWYREIMGKVFNFIVRSFILDGFKDTQCGFKCYKREAALAVFGRQKIKRFAFDVESIYIAQKIGFKIKELPVRWINSPGSKVRLIGDSSSMLLDLFRIKLYDLMGHYTI